jgi:hypothetical protein
MPSFHQWFRRYGFSPDDGVAENCNSGQVVALREKFNLALFRWDSSPELNTKKLENTLISIGYLYSHIGPTV